MLTFIIVLAIAAIVVIALMKKGKIADANNNNIPDAIENAAAKVTEEVKETVAEVKEVVKKVKAPKAKTEAAPKKKTTKKAK
jgi:hypothetical protein